MEPIHSCQPLGGPKELQVLVGLSLQENPEQVLGRGCFFHLETNIFAARSIKTSQMFSCFFFFVFLTPVKRAGFQENVYKTHTHIHAALSYTQLASQSLIWLIKTFFFSPWTVAERKTEPEQERDYFLLLFLPVFPQDSSSSRLLHHRINWAAGETRRLLDWHQVQH